MQLSSLLGCRCSPAGPRGVGECAARHRTAHAFRKLQRNQDNALPTRSTGGVRCRSKEWKIQNLKTESDRISGKERQEGGLTQGQATTLARNEQVRGGRHEVLRGTAGCRCMLAHSTLGC